MADLGYRDFAAVSWFALYVPAQTPRDAIRVITRALDATLKEADTAARLAQGGFDPWPLAPDALTAFGEKDRLRYREQVKKYGGIDP